MGSATGGPLGRNPLNSPRTAWPTTLMPQREIEVTSPTGSCQVPAGYIERKVRFDPRYGQQSNYYDLAGLVRECQPFADEIIETRQARREEDADRRRSKRPKLKVVSRASREQE